MTRQGKRGHDNSDFSDARISRFIDDRRSLNEARRWRAFLPDSRDNETSVFDTQRLRESEIWEIADRYVAPARKREVIARADLTIGSATISPLFLIRDDNPPRPPRHMAIRGWPPRDEKGRHKALAMQLSAASVTVRR